MSPPKNVSTGRFRVAGPRAARLYVRVRGIKPSGRDRGRSSDLDVHEETLKQS